MGMRERLGKVKALPVTSESQKTVKQAEVPDLSSPPSTDALFGALKQILTISRKPAKGENRTPNRKELNAKHHLRRRKSEA